MGIMSPEKQRFGVEKNFTKKKHWDFVMWVFPKNRGTPKSSILIGFSIINHPFWGIPFFGNTHVDYTHSRILKGGVFKGRGCSWGTLKIPRFPREDWGTLGNIRNDYGNHHPP